MTEQPGSVDALTEEHDGQHVELAPGDELPLRLSSDWSWEATADGSGVVQLDPVDHLTDPGYQEWLLTAGDAGETTIAADGSPNCDDEARCPERTVTFHVTVTD